MICPDETSKLVLDEAPLDGMNARIRCYALKKRAKANKAIVDRDRDLQTPQEYKDNAAMLAAAILET